MYQGKRVVVVVPAHNEERFIGETLTTIPTVIDRVVLVDDASTDGTHSIASSIADKRPLDLLRCPRNLGVGGAIAYGYRHALRIGADVVVVMAGDGQMDPRDLVRLIQPVVEGRADYAKGNRLAHPDVWRRMPLHRLAGTRLLGAASALAFGIEDIYDGQCGYTAVSARALAQLDLDALWPGYGYVNDLLAQLARASCRIAEVPVRPVYRGERSGLRPWHLGVSSFLIARGAWRRFFFRGLQSSPSPSDAQSFPTARETEPARSVFDSRDRPFLDEPQP